MLKKVLFALVLGIIVGILSACSSLTGPSAGLILNPQVVRMKVGDSQVFSASGGRSSNYRFDFDTLKPYFNIEQVASNQLKVTLVVKVPNPLYDCDCVTVTVRSTSTNPHFTEGASSDIYFQR